MNKGAWLSSGVFGLLLALLLGCSQPPTPSPTPKGAASPTPKPTTVPSPSSSPKSSATESPKTSPAAAAVSFAGKTVTIIVPVGAGGGNDITARLYAKHLPEFLPGKPTIIVRNMPGGAGTTGPNYVHSSKPDGLTALNSGSTTIMNFLTRVSAARYDLQKMEPIVGTSSGSLYYIKPGIVSKAEDLPKAKGIIFGGSGGIGWLFVTFIDILGLRPDKVITAYSAGVADTLRAFQSGEVNMSASSSEAYSSALKPYELKGEIQPLFQSGIFDDKGNIVGDPGLPPTVPTVEELYKKIYAKPPSDIAWEAYKGLLKGRSYNFILWLPSGTPDSIVSAYRDAAEKMAKSPGFRKEAALVGGEASPWLVGKAFSSELKAQLTMDLKVLNWLKVRLADYGVVIE